MKKAPTATLPGPFHFQDVASGRSVIRVDFFLAVEDLRIRFTLDLEDSRQALFDPAQGVVDQGVVAGIIGGELDHGGAARGNQGGLHVGQRWAGQGALVIHAVEDLADDMEARDLVRAADAEEDAYGLAGVHFHLVDAGQGIHRAVEHHVLRLLIEHLLQGELLQAPGAVTLGSIELALHDVELLVDLGQATFRLDQDHAVHAVGDVLADHGRGTVIHVQPRLQGLEAEALLLAGRRLGNGCAAAGAGYRMQVDGMDVAALDGIGHVDGHVVPFAYADHRAGYGIVEGPELVAAAIAETPFNLGGDQVDGDVPGC